MIFRRFARAVRDQKWSEIVVELLIVIFGVYIGIFLGDIQNDQQRARDTNMALAALESELRSDLERLDEVIAIQIQMVANQHRAVGLLGETPLNQKDLGVLFVAIVNGNDTFFPNRAAYSAMQTGGFLADLPDEALRLRISRLFEREFVRQQANADWYDELGFDFSNRISSEFWDRANSRLLTDSPDAAVRLRNGVLVLEDQGQFYLKFITETVRPEMVAVLDMIDAYQGKQKGK